MMFFFCWIFFLSGSRISAEFFENFVNFVSNLAQLAEFIALAGLDKFFSEILFPDLLKARWRKSTRLVSHAIVLFPQGIHRV
jgi:hypothetical protein